MFLSNPAAIRVGWNALRLIPAAINSAGKHANYGATERRQRAEREGRVEGHPIRTEFRAGASLRGQKEALPLGCTLLYSSGHPARLKVRFSLATRELGQKMPYVRGKISGKGAFLGLMR